jgi:hypothetical protein
MPDLTATFRPATGLANPHLQTLWGPLWRKLPSCPANASACGWPTATSSTSTGMARTRPMRRWCWCCTG